MDGLFVPFENKMNFKSCKDTRTLLHLGDLHFGHPGHCDARWKRVKDYYRNRKDVIAIGMGDYFDFSRWSDRQAMRRGGVSQSAYDRLDAMVTDDVKRAADDLSQFNWIGMLEGNHDWDFSDGTSATQMLAGLLGTRYLGTCCLIHHALDYHGGKTVITHVCHHGLGGGAKTIGGSINALEHWTKAFRANIYAMGHDHSSFVLPCTYTPISSRINERTGEVELVEHEMWFIRSGSMLRGYVPHRCSYIAVKAMPARRLAYPEITIGVKRTEVGGTKRIVSVINGNNPTI